MAWQEHAGKAGGLKDMHVSLRTQGSEINKDQEEEEDHDQRSLTPDV